MARQRAWAAALAAGLLAWCSASAFGQRVVALIADRATLAPGESATLRLATVGADGAREIAWGEAGVEWMFVRDSRSQRNHASAPVEADGKTVRVSPARAGVTMVGVDLARRVEVMGAGEFERLVERTGKKPQELETGPGKAPPRERDVRVARVESACVLVRVGGSATDIAVSKSGLATEIRSLMDPTQLLLPSDMAVRVYADGSGVPGATVIATHTASGVERRTTADDKGIAPVHLDRPGAWRLEFHHAAPARDDTADWVIYSCVLTFEAGVAAGGAR
ncbi:MAG: hypothetical protein AMXMBFR77_01970 [Phycisphaerales bacterium]|nr:DUF4198 domain-containing protein [Phycisphaerales bacterium]MDL1903892.1 DUF4198 domain-containing protein [Synechococcales cyanobacterium CNB]GIK18606.1 MAG: hypothetical protein BroJett004_07700 [Planctomycetota bacterium]